MALRRVVTTVLLVAAAGCVQGGSSIPPVSAGTGVVVEASTQTVSVDPAVVPVLVSCPPGTFVRRNLGNAGWDCSQGAVGPQGAKGDTGSIGPQGVKGDTGDKGETGFQGIQGVVGPQGLTGPQGPLGATGPTGLTGGAKLIYLRDTAMWTIGSPYFYHQEGGATSPPVVASFPFQINDATTVVLARFEGDGSYYCCGGPCYGSPISFAAFDTTSQQAVASGGLLSCSQTGADGSTRCYNDFAFSAVISAGALPPGSYEGRLTMSSPCTNPIRSWSINHASLIVWQYF